MTVAAIGIVTCDRVPSLVACIEGYLENCRQHDRTPEFLVVDDSRRAESLADAPLALEQVARRFGGSIRYAGVCEKERFARALTAESGVPLDVTQFALLGDERCDLSTGANRNSLLLDTVGSLVFSADDDTTCRIAAAPDSEAPVSIFEGYDPTEFWFFEERRLALESASFTDSDVLAHHDALLGKPVADATGSAGAAGHIAITMQGLIGDSGMASPRYYYVLSGASRERFVASEEAYRSALRSREVLRTVRRPTVCAASFFMTTFFGFDNRLLLPPFFPVQRNSDGIYGVVLQKCVHGGHVAFLPWTLIHSPASSREFMLEDLWRDAESLRMADVVVDCILTEGTTAGEAPAAARMSQLGAHLLQIGSRPLPEFEAHVRSLQQYRAAAFTALLSNRLHTHGASPSFWAADVERLLERMAAAPAADHFVVPRDLRGRHDPATARQLSRELIAKFGRLLDAWPAIVAAATRLRANGHRITRSIRGFG